jgi:hypothetical protein
MCQMRESRAGLAGVQGVEEVGAGEDERALSSEWPRVPQRFLSEGVQLDDLDRGPRRG